MTAGDPVERGGADGGSDRLVSACWQPRGSAVQERWWVVLL